MDVKLRGPPQRSTRRRAGTGPHSCRRNILWRHRREGFAEFLQTVNDDGASFVGVECVIGTLHGGAGTLVLRDQGTLKAATVTGTWRVVPGSGELRDLRGEAHESGCGCADIFWDSDSTLRRHRSSQCLHAHSEPGRGECYSKSVITGTLWLKKKGLDRCES
ncbi:DUF3224 domain-containing protein [Nonomuraea sp. NPDC050786]|uniref:DUF3224 domain-containing protein n=1 Tax=Nonomuraea sp. NPDC050786 TaxID=3154840 RepID=UPI0033F51CF4